MILAPSPRDRFRAPKRGVIHGQGLGPGRPFWGLPDGTFIGRKTALPGAYAQGGTHKTIIILSRSGRRLAADENPAARLH